MFGFKRCYSGTKRVASAMPDEIDKQRLHEAAEAVRRVSNVLGIGTCLSRSLALRNLLEKKGIRTDLRIGVDKDERRFTAHAWLEFDGTPIGDEAICRYNVLAGIR